jgi:tetratricopeptide (TPR) repeat protein
MSEELVSEFRIVQVLAEDHGMVRALAHDRRLDRPVLLVLLRPGGDPKHAESFLASMRLLARVDHPGVRAVQQAGVQADCTFAALEHVPGEPLADRLARGRVRREVAVAYGLELLDALEASHRHGIAHPDLLASTVVLGEGRLVIDGVGALPADPSTEQAELGGVARILYHAVTGRPWERSGSKPFAGVPLFLRAILRRALVADTNVPRLDHASFRRALVAARRRSRSLAAGLVLLGSVVAARWLPPLPWRSSEPTVTEVAVLPLAARDPLELAVAELLTQNLKGILELRLTPSKRIERWAAGYNGQVEGAEGHAPRALGVRWAVQAFVDQSPRDTLHVRLTLYGWDGAKVPLTEVAAPVRDLPGLGKQLSLSLLKEVAPDLEPRVGRLEDLAGFRFEAVKSFLQGEAAFDRDAWTEARDYYETAIARDTGFALAKWRLANVQRWERQPYDFFGNIRRLHQNYGERLGAADTVIQALLESDLDRRLNRLDSLASRPRADAYVRYLYAEELFHRGPLLGKDVEDAVRAMRRTIERDSSFAEAYGHLFGAYLRAGRRDTAREVLDLRRRIATGARPGDLDKVRFMQLAYDARFHRWRAWFRLQWLKLASDSTLARVTQVARLGAPWFDIPETQVDLCRILLANATTASARASAHNGIALGLLTLGRPAEALAHLDSSIALAGDAEARLQRAEWEVIPPLVGLPRFASPGSHWREALEPAGTDPASKALAPRIQWALAAGSLGAGDTAGFVAHTDTLEILAPGSPLAVLLRAMHVARDQPDRALEISDSARAALSVNHPPDPFAGSVYHLLRAQWHLSAVHEGTAHRLAADSALRWIDGSDFDGWPVGAVQAGEIDAAFGVYARWRRGDAALTYAATPMDTAAACARLRRVVELWSGSDSVLHPLRDSAATRVKACRT